MAIAVLTPASGSNAGGTTVSVTKDAGWVEGSLLVAHIAVRGGTGATIVGNVAWQSMPTNGRVNSTTVLASLVVWRFAGPDEPATYTWTFGTGSHAAANIDAYSGADLTNPIDVSSGQANASSTTVTAPAVTVGTANCWLIMKAAVAYGTTLSTWDTPLTERTDASSTTGAATGRTTAGSADSNGTVSTGSTGNKTTTAANAAVNIGHLIAIKPQTQTGTTFTGAVAASADDATASNAATAVSITATVGYFGDSSNSTACSGMRFTNVTVPNGATINYAYLRVQTPTTYAAAAANTIEVDMACQAADNPGAFTTTGTDLGTGTRPRTTAKRLNWALHDMASSVTEIIPITSAVQEIVNRAGWASGQAMVVIADNSGSTASEWQDIAMYDHATVNEPRITINYSTGLEIDPTGIATAEAFGTAQVNLGLALTGIASAEAFGTAGIVLGLAPTGIATTEAFGTAQANLGIAGTGIATAEAFGTANLSGAQQIDPTGIATAEAFGTAQANLGIAASGLATAEAFGDAVVSSGQTITASGIATAEAFGTAQLNLSLALTGIATAEAFGTANVSGPNEDWNVSVGSGYTDVSPKQLVRTSGNILYIAASDCDSYPCEAVAQTLRMYKSDSTGIPTGFTRQDSADEPAGVAGWSIALDSTGLIHVAWTYRTGDGNTLAGLRYTTYNTSTDQWGASVETIVSGGLTDSVGQGVQTVALVVDSSDVPHLVYLSGNGTARRVYYRNRSGGSWSSATQIDSGVSYTGNLRAWHPNIVLDESENRVVAWLRGSFNTDNDGTIFTSVYKSGSWQTEVNVSGTNAARVTIDQSTSMLVTPNGTYHLTFLTSTNDYIRYYYSTNDGDSWTANNPGSGTQVTHNPSLGPGPGSTIRIYGHDTPASPPDGHGEDVYYFEGSGGASAWGSWTLVIVGTNYDSSINTRWSMHHWWYPHTLDIGYWNDNYPNNLYTGTSVEALDIQPSGIATAEAFGTAALTLTLSLAGIATAEAFGTAGISQPGSIAPAGIASLEAFGDATVTAAATISATGIASLEAFGSAALGLVVNPSGIGSAESVSEPALVLVVNASGIATLEAFGTATITAAGLITPTGIASLEAFGSAQIIEGLLNQPGTIEIIIRRATGIEVIRRPLTAIELIVREL